MCFFFLGGGFCSFCLTCFFLGGVFCSVLIQVVFLFLFFCLRIFYWFCHFFGGGFKVFLVFVFVPVFLRSLVVYFF